MTTTSSKIRVHLSEMIDGAALLDFSDVIEHLAKVTEMDIVPHSFIDYVKDDTTKVNTMIEYKAAKMALMDDTLLVCFESIELYYKICQKQLAAFREHGSSCIPQTWRDDLTSYTSAKHVVFQLIRSAEASDTFGVKVFETAKILYSIDLSSKLLMCYNGEYGQSFTVRIDLILLGLIKDLEKELTILCIIHKRFKKSSIAWHYRKVVFMCALTQAIERVHNSLSGSKGKVVASDLDPIKGLWERELDRIEPIINKHGRSYKIWEYLVHMATYLNESLTSLRASASTLPQNLSGSFDTEVEILLVQGFIAWYDRVKELARRNVHNHCTFGLLINIVKILLNLNLDTFMDSADFYSTFLTEHLAWIDELRSYYKLVYGKPEGQQQSKIRTMESERIKLESLEEHAREITHHLSSLPKQK